MVSKLGNFKYDQQFDQALFSLTPPKDYKPTKASDKLKGTREQLDETIDKIKE